MSRFSRPAKILPRLACSSSNDEGLVSGKIKSSSSSSSLSAATKRFKSTLSAQLPSKVPMLSRSYIFSTSTGISFRFKAAILSRPDVLPALTRFWRTFFLGSSPRQTLKGSLWLTPKSNPVSEGMIGASWSPSWFWFSAACFNWARLAALAFAICSRRAADDLRVEGGVPGSAESPVKAVLVDAIVEALDGIVPSQEVFDELPEARFAPCKEDWLSAGRDGFLKRPLTGALGLVGRVANDLEFAFGGGMLGLPGLGLLAAESDESLEAGLRAPWVDIREPGVLAPEITEVRFCGVPLIVLRGGL